jgi:hypothetical protein
MALNAKKCNFLLISKFFAVKVQKIRLLRSYYGYCKVPQVAVALKKLTNILSLFLNKIKLTRDEDQILNRDFLGLGGSAVCHKNCPF